MTAAAPSLAARVSRRARAWRWLLKRPEDTVVSVRTGLHPERRGARLCLFATYDPQGVLDPCVVHYLTALKAAGFDVVVIATSEDPDETTIRPHAGLWRRFIVRRNIGLDFASWAAALALDPDLTDYDRILFANDSAYGPFGPLGPLLDRLEALPAAVTALTDSRELAHHLQSWFLYCKREAWRDGGLMGFWRDVRPLLYKDWVISRYEVGLGRWLAARGIPFAALAPTAAVHTAAGRRGSAFPYVDRLASGALNPSLHMWDLLLTEFGIPFLKREVVRDNRLAHPAAARWREFLPPGQEALAGKIETQLRRLGGQVP